MRTKKPIHFLRSWINIKKYITGHWIDRILFIVCVLSPCILIGVLSNWIWAFIFFVVLLAAFARPFDARPEVLIAFAVFIFVGLNALWQKESFELRNRPYIEINRWSVTFNLNGLRVWMGKVQPKLVLNMRMINHGDVPATVRNVIVKVNTKKEDLFSKECLDFGSEKGVYKDWKNFDVYPSSSVEKNKRFEMWQYINLDELNKLMTSQIKESISKNNIDQFEPLLKSISTLKPLKNIYVFIQIEYTAVGEQKSYYYWVIYKTNNLQIYTIESGVNNALRPKM